MADLSQYFKNRVKYHAASRLASQTGEGLVQALNVDGHTVSYDKVWSAPAINFPNNANKSDVNPVNATNDLVKVFKTAEEGYSITSAAFHDKADNGIVWKNSKYPAVVLYENVPMTKVSGSDGKDSKGNARFQSYEVLAGENGIASGTTRIVDWVSPTAVADRELGSPVAGFSGIPQYGATRAAMKSLQAVKPSEWSNGAGNWEFVYMAGLLTFDPDYTPQFIDATNGVNNVYLTAFKYVGGYLKDTLDKTNKETSDAITTINKSIEDLTVQAGAKEILATEAVFDKAAGTVGGALSGLTGTIVDGLVTVNMPAAYEVINVKEDDGDAITPDIDYTSTNITLTADYGLQDIVPNSWTITYRV
jgi:hypothetical protein